MQRQLVLDYLKSSVAQARLWIEACLDPEDDCPAFRDHARAILRDAEQVLKMKNLFPEVVAAINEVHLATYASTMHLANERLQDLTELLQALEAEIALEEVSGDAASEAKAAATTTSQ